MSKNYKKKREIVEEIVNEEELSKKELYDLNKEKKQNSLKEKKKKKKKKNENKTYKTSLAGRIFAIIMLILMLGSVIATIATYMR